MKHAKQTWGWNYMTWSWANTDITLPRSSFMSVSFLWLLPKCAQTAIAIDKLDAKETILHRRESNAEKGLQGGEGCFQFNIWVTFQTENRKDGHGCEVAKPYQEERSQSTSWLWGTQFERIPGGGGGITVGFYDQKNNIYRSRTQNTDNTSGNTTVNPLGCVRA